MAELELERPRPEREAEELVAEADAEERLPRVDERPDRRDARGERRRVAGAVREEEAVERRELRRRRGRREDGDVEAPGLEVAEDVPLDAVVDRRDARTVRCVGAPGVGRPRPDLERERGARHRRLLED